MLTSPRRNRARGFTLIELLVVIAIIAVLIGLLVPAVQKVREAAAKMSCQNNMHQLGIACAMYANDRGNRFPVGAQSAPAGGGASWLVLILPYIEQDNLYKQYNFTNPFSSNLGVGAIKVPLFYCPSGSDQTAADTSPTLNYSTHYYGNMGPGSGSGYNVQNAGTNSASGQDGVLLVDAYAPQPGAGIKITEIKDGTSNTILAGERSITERTGNSYLSWIRGFGGSGTNIFTGACKNVTTAINSTAYNGTNNMQDISFGSNHTHGANFVMCDGSTHFITDDVSPTILMALASRNGGEVVQVP